MSSRCNNACVPKIIGESLADHRDQVRQRLFAAMRDLIADRGYDNISLADVAAGAGVGRTAVYNHFSDKESVLLAWAQDETEAYLGRLRAELDGQSDPIQRLKIFVRMQMKELARHHSRLAGIGTALSAEGRQAMRIHVAPMMALLREMLVQAMTAGAIAEQDVDTSLAMISSVTTGRFTIGLTEAELDRTVQAATEFVLHGLGAGPSA